MVEPMTAEDRAALIHKTTVDVMCSVGSPRPIPAEAWYADQIRAAEDAAAERMRERCRQIADRELGWSDKNMNGVASRIALEISALTPRLFAVKGDEDG